MRKISHGVAQCSAAAFIVFAVAGCGGGGGGGGTAAPVSTGTTTSSAPAAPPSTQGPTAIPVAIPVPASLSGPSILPSGVPGRFEAAELPVGTAVTVLVRDPSGVEQSFSAMIGDDGRLSYNITVGTDGMHNIRMTDAAGRELVRANFIGL